MRQTTEKWRDVPGYAGWYQASNAGRIRTWHSLNGQGRSKTPRIMKQKAYQGCVKVGLRNPDTGKQAVVSVASIIYKTWIGEVPPGKRVCHKRMNANDNRPENLVLSDLRFIAFQMNAKKNGPHNRKPVVKMDTDLTVVAVYPSARQAQRQNFFGDKTLIDYCNLKRTTVIAGDGYIYAWDDERWLRKTIARAMREMDAAGIRYTDPGTEEYWNLPPESGSATGSAPEWAEAAQICGGVPPRRTYENRSVRA